ADRKVLPTSLAFGRRSREAGLVASMGSGGDCYNNAITGSFFATLECELLHRRRFRTQTQGRVAVFDYLEGFYNPRRRHSALRQHSPADYERSQQLNYAATQPCTPLPQSLLHPPPSPLRPGPAQPGRLRKEPPAQLRCHSAPTCPPDRGNSRA